MLWKALPLKITDSQMVTGLLAAGHRSTGVTTQLLPIKTDVTSESKIVPVPRQGMGNTN